MTIWLRTLRRTIIGNVWNWKWRYTLTDVQSIHFISSTFARLAELNWFYICHGCYVFALACLSVCLSVSRISQKVADELRWKIFGEVEWVTCNSWFNIDGGRDHDANTVICKRIFIAEFGEFWYAGNAESYLGELCGPGGCLLSVYQSGCS